MKFFPYFSFVSFVVIYPLICAEHTLFITSIGKPPIPNRHVESDVFVDSSEANWQSEAGVLIIYAPGVRD